MAFILYRNPSFRLPLQIAQSSNAVASKHKALFYVPRPFPGGIVLGKVTFTAQPLFPTRFPSSTDPP